MDYPSAREYLFSLGRFGIKPGLERINKLLTALGSPHKDIPTIHVAGTNGKGSVCAMLEGILSSQGYQVGLYSSPHLISLRERIQISKELVREEFVANWTAELKKLSSDEEITFFEAMTAMAFSYFKEHKADIIILETGLGGRWDATNITNAKLSVITPIGTDHSDVLGETIAKIAAEKAGIIKKDSNVITYQENSSALTVITDQCSEQGAMLTRIDPEQISISQQSLQNRTMTLHTSRNQYSLKIPLAGRHQFFNAALAVIAAENIKDCYGISVHAKHIERGISQSLWPARGQVFSSSSKTMVIDAAHNPDGLQTLIPSLSAIYDRTDKKTAPLFVMAFSEDKDFLTMLSTVLKTKAKVIITSGASPRLLNAQEVVKKTKEIFPNISKDKIEAAESVQEVLKHQNYKQAELICICGSLLLAGDWLGLIAQKQIKGRFEKGHSKMIKWFNQVKSEFQLPECKANIR